jgi:fructoselysine-6-phosphate deglycase
MTMRNFDEKKYRDAAQKNYAQRPVIEAIADKIKERGYDNIIIIGIGGTWMEWHPVVHVMRHYTDMPIYLENAAELIVREDKRYLTKKSLVITSSSSGDTKEILASVDMCKDMGIEVCGFTKNQETPLGKRLDYLIENVGGDCEHSYVLYFLLGLRLLYDRNEYPHYPAFAYQIKSIFDNLIKFRESFESTAAELARKYAKEPYSIFIGSGTLYGETYLFTMCILEEMQWIRTRHSSSADFFHGLLELVEPGVPVFLFKGVDEHRPLDERVEKFCNAHTDKFTVIDIDDYKLEGIDDEFRVICSPMILTALTTERLAAHYELVTGHSLEFRRYYRQFDY